MNFLKLKFFFSWIFFKILKFFFFSWIVDSPGQQAVSDGGHIDFEPALGRPGGGIGRVQSGHVADRPGDAAEDFRTARHRRRAAGHALDAGAAAGRRPRQTRTLSARTGQHPRLFPARRLFHVPEQFFRKPGHRVQPAQ